MIHSVTSSGKFRKFVRRLKAMDCFTTLPIAIETVAVGILERLWHIGISERPRGDIGHLDNEIIADQVGWDQDEDELIRLLVDTGWLDECEEHRLVIHDWHEHAPNHIKKNIHRRGGFVTETSSGEEACQANHPHVSEDAAESSSPEPVCAHTKPNVTKRNPTKRNGTERESGSTLTNQPDPDTEFGLAWNRWLEFRFARDGVRVDQIRSDTWLMRLNAIPPDKAIEDIHFSIEKGAKSILDSANDFAANQMRRGQSADPAEDVLINRLRNSKNGPGKYKNIA